MGALTFSLPGNVPSDYTDLAEVLSKQRATTLPPHRPYDCAIELHPGTIPPRDCYIPSKLLRAPP